MAQAKAETHGNDTPKFRRWVSSSTEYSIMEYHEELTDGPTGRHLGYITKRIGPDGNPLMVKETQLKQIRFHPARVAIPAGIGQYEVRILGVCVTKDLDEIKMLEAATREAKRAGHPDDCREYPIEFENSLRNAGQELKQASDLMAGVELEA